jgi:hypothetical protein
MSIVWGDPRSEQHSQALREVAERLLAESNPEEVEALVEQLTQLMKTQVLTFPPN